MSRFSRKVDGNQRAIVAALELLGCKVQSLANVAGGCPDLAVWRAGRWTLLEIKRDKAAKLTPAQVVWHKKFAGAATVVRTVEQAFDAVGLRAPDPGCPTCQSGSLEHPDRCECPAKCHLRQRKDD